MKALKLLLMALVSTAIFVACGNSGGGSAPGGYPTYPTIPGSGNGSNGVTESDIVESYFGQARVSSTSAVKSVFGHMLPFKTDINSGIFSVGYYYNQTVPDLCTEFAYFKPSCQSYFPGYYSYQACDYPYEVYGGAQDCSSYNNDEMAIWVEKKSNGKIRVKIMANADSWTTTGSIYLAVLTFDEIDPNDTRYVQAINGGNGMRITILGEDLSAAFNKFIRIDLEDMSGSDSEDHYTDAEVYYGTTESLSKMVGPRMRKQNLL